MVCVVNTIIILCFFVFACYSLSNPASLPLSGSGSFKVSSAQGTTIPYSSYPGSSDLTSRYVQQSSQYNSSSDRPNSNSTAYNESNHNSVSFPGELRGNFLYVFSNRSAVVFCPPPPSPRLSSLFVLKKHRKLRD